MPSRRPAPHHSSQRHRRHAILGQLGRSKRYGGFTLARGRDSGSNRRESEYKTLRAGRPGRRSMAGQRGEGAAGAEEAPVGAIQKPGGGQRRFTAGQRGGWVLGDAWGMT